MTLGDKARLREEEFDAESARRAAQVGPTDDPTQNALVAAQTYAAVALRRCAIMRVEPDTYLQRLESWLEEAGFPVSVVHLEHRSE